MYVKYYKIQRVSSKATRMMRLGWHDAEGPPGLSRWEHLWMWLLEEQTLIRLKPWRATASQ